jgi:hypothetical protein
MDMRDKLYIQETYVVCKAHEKFINFSSVTNNFPECTKFWQMNLISVSELFLFLMRLS